MICLTEKIKLEDRKNRNSSSLEENNQVDKHR